MVMAAILTLLSPLNMALLCSKQWKRLRFTTFSLSPFCSSRPDYGTFGSSRRKQFEAAISEGKLAEALSHIQDKPIKTFADVPLRIAVVGEPDAGKSTFIKTVQSPYLGELDAAAADAATGTGIPDYTEEEFGQVSFSEIRWNKELLRLEDADGKEVDLKDFHYVIVVDPEFCQDIPLHLVLKIQKMDLEYSLVQTKADLHLEEASKDSEDLCRESLKNKGVRNAQVFAFSSNDPQGFSSSELRKTLASDFLWNRILAVISPILKQKADHLKKNGWLLTVISGFIAAIPIPGIAFLGGLVILIMFGDWIYHKFGVDKASLSKLDNSSKVELKSQSKKKMVLQRLPDFLGSSVMISEYFYWNRFPIIGCILSVVISLISSFFTLTKLPSDVKKDTQNVMCSAVKQKKTDPENS